MNDDINFVAHKLIDIRLKHKDYFVANKVKIVFCVKINWDHPISAHLQNHLLPFEIANDLESMFWID